MMTRRVMVIGVGNPDRGDDAVGRTVARMLRWILPNEVEVAQHRGEATDLATLIEGVAAAYLVDASAADTCAGTVRRFDVGAAPLPQRMFGLSTHGFGLAEAIELSRALGGLPPRCIVYAIEGKSFEVGAPLSPRVSAAVAVVIQSLVLEIVGNTVTGE